MKKNNKLDNTFKFRIDTDTKNKFIKLCHDLNISASGLLNSFIKDFINEKK